MRLLVSVLATIAVLGWRTTPAPAKDAKRKRSPVASERCGNRFHDDGGRTSVSVARLPGWAQQTARGSGLGVGSILLENEDWERVWFDTFEGNFNDAVQRASAGKATLGSARHSTMLFDDGNERVVIEFIDNKRPHRPPYFYLRLSDQQYVYVGGRLRPGRDLVPAVASLRTMTRTVAAIHCKHGFQMRRDGSPPPNVDRPPRYATRTKRGVYYQVLRRGPGTGPRPTKTSRVEVHYVGWTTDGTMFDSSIKRNKSATFPLNRVIEGWSDGVQHMRAGDIFRMWIPERLAYKGRTTAPRGMLVFDIELIAVLN